MLAVVGEVATDQERRVGLALEAVDGVRLLRSRETPDLEDRAVAAVERNIEIALPPKAVAPIPSGLIPVSRYIDPMDVVGPSPRKGRLEILRESGQEFPIRAGDEPAPGFRGVSITVTVAIEKSLHHLAGRRDNRGEVE